MMRESRRLDKWNGILWGVEQSGAGLTQTPKRSNQGSIWELPKMGDPNIAPLIVGSLLEGPQIRYP